MKAIHINLTNQDMMLHCACMCTHIDMGYICVPSYLSS